MTPVAHRYKSNEEYIYVRGRGRGKYVCEECGIRCKKPSMLKKHIRTHTDVRPYVCKHCHFAFKTKGKRQSAGAPPCPWQGSPLGEPQHRALCPRGLEYPHILSSHSTWYPWQSSDSSLVSDAHRCHSQDLDPAHKLPPVLCSIQLTLGGFLQIITLPLHAFHGSDDLRHASLSQPLLHWRFIPLGATQHTCMSTFLHFSPHLASSDPPDFSAAFSTGPGCNLPPPPP